MLWIVSGTLGKNSHLAVCLSCSFVTVHEVVKRETSVKIWGKIWPLIFGCLNMIQFDKTSLV